MAMKDVSLKSIKSSYQTEAQDFVEAYNQYRSNYLEWDSLVRRDPDFYEKIGFKLASQYRDEVFGICTGPGLSVNPPDELNLLTSPIEFPKEESQMTPDRVYLVFKSAAQSNYGDPPLTEKDRDKKFQKIAVEIVKYTKRLNAFNKKTHPEFLEKLKSAMETTVKKPSDTGKDLAGMLPSGDDIEQMSIDASDILSLYPSFVEFLDYAMGRQFEKERDIIEKLTIPNVLYYIKDLKPGTEAFAAALRSAYLFWADKFKYVSTGGDNASYARIYAEKVGQALKFFQNPDDAASKLDKKLSDALKKKVRDVGSKAEAPPSAPLGQIAFGEEREDAPFEKDTPVEKKLHAALERHISDNIPLSDAETDLISSFLRKEYYSKLFIEPSVETVYRGMTVKREWLAAALKMTKAEEAALNKDGSKGSVEKNFTLTPRRKNATSWSSSLAAAKEFMWSGVGDVAVILHAYVEDNSGKLLDLKKLYDVRGFQGYTREKEVIGMGKIKVYKVSWVTRD